MTESFEAFVEAHYQSAYRFALSLCGHEADACDLTQQAFGIAQAKFQQVRDPSKRKSWLFTTLHREFLRGRRRRAAHPHEPLESVEDELPLITVDHAARIDSHGLLATLLGLDEHYRVPLSLFYFEQLSYKEIAELIEVPIGTVMSRLSRGKELLRQAFEEHRPADVRGFGTAGTQTGPTAQGGANPRHG